MTTEELFEDLASLGISTRTYEHAPVRTVAEARRLRGDLPGGHCKNLLLADRAGRLYLLVVLESRRVDLASLASALAADRRLSFAKPEALSETLGVAPGAVTPLAVPNDRDGRVQVVLDREILRMESLNFHPLRNDRTTAISSEDLVRFLTARGHVPRVVDL